MGIRVGMRVRLTRDVERFSISLVVPSGETGTVVWTDNDLICLKMDREFPALKDWNNELVWDVLNGDKEEDFTDSVEELK